MEMFPFPNIVVCFTIKGEILYRLLDTILNGRKYQVGGFQYKFTRKLEDKNEIIKILSIIDGERKSEGMEKEEKETLLKIADYVDKQKKQAIIRAAVLFSLEMLCCGFTIASAILVLNSKGQISAGYAVVPMFLTFVCSIALVINAKDYVGKIQRQQ